MQILRSPGISSTAPMEVLVTRDRPDQPWVVAGSVRLHDGTRDRVYVANNDLGRQPRTAAVDVSDNARMASGPAGFKPSVIERRAPSGQDGPPVRIAASRRHGVRGLRELARRQRSRRGHPEHHVRRRGHP